MANEIDERLRSRVQRIARELPLAMVRRAVAIGLAQPDVALRGQFIRALRDRMDLRFMRAMDGEERIDVDAFRAASEYVSSIVGAEKVNAILPSARLVWTAPEFGRWLSDLLPPFQIDEPLRNLLLEKVTSISHEQVRARALALVAPLISPDRQVVGLSSNISDGWTRARTLGLLGIYLPGSAHREAVAAAETIASRESRALAVAALAPHLTYAMRPTRHLLEKTLLDLANAPPAEPKARALTAFIPILRGLFPDLLPIVERASATIEPPDVKRYIEEAMALPWPQPYIASADRALARSVGQKFVAPIDNSFAQLDATLRAMAQAAGEVTASTPPMDRGGGEKSVAPSIRASEPTGSIAPAKPRERFVNLGFANAHTPGQALPGTSTLAAYYEYVFWVEVGALQSDSIVKNPTQVLSEQEIPAGARLEVVLFGMPGGIRVWEYYAIGELIFAEDGSVNVLRQPDDPSPREHSDLRKQRLFFRVRAPEVAGPARLRCNIYYERNLVQSHLVTAMVTRVPRENVEDALSSTVDYSLSRTLDSGHLSELATQRLSVMINSNGDGSHEFMFFGKNDGVADKPDFREECTLSPSGLKDIIDIGRKALRRVAWGDDEPWSGAQSQRYRYEGRNNRAQFPADLITLARAGYRMYADLVKDVAGGKEKVADLARLMRQRGLVQVALKERAEHVFPAALLYDYAIDTNSPKLELCPTFLAALDANIPLDNAPCFNHGCDASEHLDRVCPSGFWGYRHALGLPLSTKHAPDAPTTLKAANGVGFTVLVSTDPLFTLRADHLKELRRQCAPTRWGLADTRDKSFDHLQKDRPHLVYFYGHGGVTKDNVPYIEVGAPNSGGGILKDNLVAYKIGWKEPQPLVFLNGCRTTALDPEAAFSLVSAFVEDCSAAGVIGTEITIFEPLACRFAEECLRYFFVDKMMIGEAVRRARLALLQESNPLGLVYIPFVHTGLHLAS